MTQTKRRISVLLIVALIVSMFVAFGTVNANAKKKCKHKSTTTSFSQANNNQHYRIVKCKKCGKQISKKKEKCYQGGVRHSYKQDCLKYHKTTYICKCGRKKTNRETHNLEPADENWDYMFCKNCGKKAKLIKFESVGLPD